MHIYLLRSMEQEFLSLIKPFSTYCFSKNKNGESNKLSYDYDLKFRSLAEELNFIKEYRTFQERLRKGLLNDLEEQRKQFNKVIT